MLNFILWKFYNLQCVTLVEADAYLGRVLALIQVFSVRSLTHRGHNIGGRRHIAIGNILAMRSSGCVPCLLKSFSPGISCTDSAQGSVYTWRGRDPGFPQSHSSTQGYLGTGGNWILSLLSLDVLIYVDIYNHVDRKIKIKY